MPSGSLYVVSTPIGNLEDITLRAVRILKEVDFIAAEDTRHTQKLLSHFGIHKNLTSYHDHNKEQKTPVIITRILEGQSVALVSDAGTPVISDPGYYLINKAIENKVAIVPIPGPTAAIAALSVSGLPTDAFVFEGFLPSRRSQRLSKLESLNDERRTIIFYEAPHKILNTLLNIRESMGERRVSLSRELTKIHEETLRGNISDIIKAVESLSGSTAGAGKGLSARGRSTGIRGEITLIIEGVTCEPPPAAQGEDLAALVERLMRGKGLSRKAASEEVAKLMGLSRKEVYDLSLKK
ncbi:MAG: 16S rRNA (cytidine(1402)-2'-O)-methyltransferase [Nitrospirota bacterium]